MKPLSGVKLILAVFAFLLVVSPLQSASFKERPEPVSVLVLLGEWFGDSYYPLNEEINARGWKMKRVGVDVEYRGCYNKKRDVTLRSDILIPDLKDFSGYDCLIIPSGPQFRKFKENPVVLQFVMKAHAAGLLVASFCVGNNVVKDAGLIDIPYGPSLFPEKVTMVKERILLGPRGGGPPPGDGYKSAPIKEVCDVIDRELQFYGTFRDPRDGNFYRWVKIGNQIWMAENLRATHYQNGTPISEITDNNAWSKLTTSAFCWYKNESGNYMKAFGPLYNYHAVNDSRKLAPPGWHIPTKEEWSVLCGTLGGEKTAGRKLKSTTNWEGPNVAPSNESCFNALPAGGRRFRDGSFGHIGDLATFWSSTDVDSEKAWNVRIFKDSIAVDYHDVFKGDACSVRCIKDEETE